MTHEHTPSGAPVDEQDPLSQAAGGIDTTIPMLQPDRTMRLECVECKVVGKKDDETRKVLNITCKTTTDGTFTDGKTAHAGYKLYKRISVSESAPKEGSSGRDRKAIARDLAALLKAFYGATTTKTPAELLANPSMLEKLPVDGRINIEKGSGGFPDRNGVSFVIPA